MMRTIDRIQAILAAVLFLAALVAAWKVAMEDDFALWHLPLLVAVASGLLTLGALQHRVRKHKRKETKE